MFPKLNVREPFFFRPPLQYAFRWQSYFLKSALFSLENTNLLPVERPYFLIVESENEIFPLLNAFSRFVPYRATAFWVPHTTNWSTQILFFLGNGIHVSDDADVVSALLTPPLRRPPTWAELRAVFAVLSGEKADEAVLNASHIQAFFDAFGGVNAVHMAFDRARARALEEAIRIHQETMIQKNCAVIAPWQKSSLLAAPNFLWLPIAQAVGERVFPVVHRTEQSNQRVFRVLASFDHATTNEEEPQWVQTTRERWHRSVPHTEKSR